MNTGQNVRVTVRYVGAGFAGWQVQPGERTVQGEIERALSQIAGREVRVHGAGRTDAGVHALAQVCSFRWEAEADLDKLCRSLTRMLGPEIQCIEARAVPDEFHARKSATAKRYWYTLSLSKHPDPFTAPFAWTPPRGVDIDRLRSLCPRFEGEHDFAGYQCGGAGEKESTVRTIYSMRVAPGGVMAPCDARDLWHIEFNGSGFLYKMVRNITGAVIDAARGNIPESRLDDLLASGGPYRGHTAPAHGLTLVEVEY
jgi:tRNA pseudouridine38-40 synthase